MPAEWLRSFVCVCVCARACICVCLHVGGRRTRSMKREKIHEEHIAKHLHQAKHLHKAYLAVLAHEVHEHKEHQEEHVRSTTCNKQPLDHLQQTTTCNKQPNKPVDHLQQTNNNRRARITTRGSRSGRRRLKNAWAKPGSACPICVSARYVAYASGLV